MYTNATTELFDHGGDSITALISAIIFCHVFQTLEFPTLSFFLIMSVFTIFYLHTWEHNATAVMTFRLTGNPTEGLFCSIATLLLTSLLSWSFWLSEVMYEFIL